MPPRQPAPHESDLLNAVSAFKKAIGLNTPPRVHDDIKEGRCQVFCENREQANLMRYLLRQAFSRGFPPGFSDEVTYVDCEMGLAYWVEFPASNASCKLLAEKIGELSATIASIDGKPRRLRG